MSKNKEQLTKQLLQIRSGMGMINSGALDFSLPERKKELGQIL